MLICFELNTPRFQIRKKVCKTWRLPIIDEKPSLVADRTSNKVNNEQKILSKFWVLFGLLFEGLRCIVLYFHNTELYHIFVDANLSLEINIRSILGFTIVFMLFKSSNSVATLYYICNLLDSVSEKGQLETEARRIHQQSPLRQAG